jgi:hypothetical protein
LEGEEWEEEEPDECDEDEEEAAEEAAAAASEADSFRSDGSFALMRSTSFRSSADIGPTLEGLTART